jgi:hypothetical protein
MLDHDNVCIFIPQACTSCFVNKGCVCGGLAIYIKKYLQAREELWKLKYLFHHAKIYLIFKKIL